MNTSTTANKIEVDQYAAKLASLFQLADAPYIHKILLQTYRDYSYNLVNDPEKINNDSPDQLYYLGLVLDVFDTSDSNKG